MLWLDLYTELITNVRTCIHAEMVELATLINFAKLVHDKHVKENSA